jgi:urate oxidase
MAIRLGENNYGKQRVRLLKRSKRDSRYDIQELTLGIRLEGDFETAHTQGDNRKILPTDTMKNTVYALARRYSIESPEQFCLLLLEHFLSRNSQVSRAQIDASETLWMRIPAASGQFHPHTFTRSSEEKRTASVRGSREEKTVSAGIEGLVVLNATNSAFEHFLRDEYTTLKEDRNRILATVIRAGWTYRASMRFDETWNGVRQALLETFAAHDSESLQQTLYAMAEAILKRFQDIREISLSLPNKHYNLADLSPLGLDNPGELFLPTDEPHGLIEATLRND